MKAWIHDIKDLVIPPTWLYVKKHNVTGLKYFGKTTSDPNIYKGSGKYWKFHLAMHANDVTTIWTHCFTDINSLVDFALYFSKMNRIVESNEWANLMEENGLDGNNKGCISVTKGKTLSKETKLKMSLVKKGKIPTWLVGKPVSAETKIKISKAQQGNTYCLGRKYSEASIKRFSESAKNVKKVQCLYCLRVINPAAFVQFHGENCKQNLSKINIRKRKECNFCGGLFVPNILSRFHGENCKYRRILNEKI